MVAIERLSANARFRPLRLPWQRANALEEFIRLPNELLRDDPLRTPLLDLEQADLVDQRAHPFYRAESDTPGAELQLFLARRDGRAVGRIGAIVNHHHNAFESTQTGRIVRTGHFGFYEAIDDQAVADALLGAAADWLRERGMVEMLGPASPSHNYYYGARSTAQEPAPLTPSRFLEVYSPEYYNQHFAGWGMSVARRLFGYDADLESEPVRRVSARFERTIRETIGGTGMRIRRLDLADFDGEITRANDLINRSLAENWGFSPMSRAELAYMGKQMRLLIDPALVLFVELDDRPVGISLAIPDYNQLFRAMGGRLAGWTRALGFDNLPFTRALWPHGNAWATSHIDVCRVIALGIVPTVWRGTSAVRRELLRLGPALIYETFTNAHRAGYRYLTASWILEDNRAMQAPFELVGIEPSRIWNIWQRSLVA